MRGFQTPPNIPTETVCLRFVIPDSPEWRSLVEGAVLALTQTYNWQQTGDNITPDDAANCAFDFFLSATYSSSEDCG